MARRPSNHVFISYSHLDRVWLASLQAALKRHDLTESFIIWDDTKILAGDRWKEEIDRALEGAKVGILLVSANFLASQFITECELPYLLDAASKGRLRLIWVAVSHSDDCSAQIRQYQAANDPKTPIDSLDPDDQQKAWDRICEQLKIILWRLRDREVRKRALIRRSVVAGVALAAIALQYRLAKIPLILDLGKYSVKHPISATLSNRQQIVLKGIDLSRQQTIWEGGDLRNSVAVYTDAKLDEMTKNWIKDMQTGKDADFGKFALLCSTDDIHQIAYTSDAKSEKKPIKTALGIHFNSSSGAKSMRTDLHLTAYLPYSGDNNAQDNRMLDLWSDSADLYVTISPQWLIGMSTDVDNELRIDGVGKNVDITPVSMVVKSPTHIQFTFLRRQGEKPFARATPFQPFSFFDTTDHPQPMLADSVLVQNLAGRGHAALALTAVPGRSLHLNAISETADGLRVKVSGEGTVEEHGRFIEAGLYAGMKQERGAAAVACALDLFLLLAFCQGLQRKRAASSRHAQRTAVADTALLHDPTRTVALQSQSDNAEGAAR